MPRVERGFLLGSLIGPFAGVLTFAVHWLPNFLVGLVSLQLDGSDINYCEMTVISVELGFFALVSIPASAMLAWFIARERNKNQPVDRQASASAAASAAGISALLVLAVIVAGSEIFICNDPLAV